MLEIHNQLFDFILWAAKSVACQHTLADVFFRKFKRTNAAGVQPDRAVFCGGFGK